jgi:predicted acetyltransferase
MFRGLMDDYLRELGTFRELPHGATCADEYRYLPYYWREDSRFPFLLVHDDEAVGFCLVRRMEERREPTMQLAEFYVVPQHRRRGLGSMAAGEIWRLFPGAWELQVMLGNPGGLCFWTGLVEENAEAGWEQESFDGRDGPRVELRFRVPPSSRRPHRAVEMLRDRRPGDIFESADRLPRPVPSGPA